MNSSFVVGESPTKASVQGTAFCLCERAAVSSSQGVARLWVGRIGATRCLRWVARAEMLLLFYWLVVPELFRGFQLAVVLLRWVQMLRVMPKGVEGMGFADSVARKYIGDPARFADVFNYAVYGGRQVIRPRELRPLDSTMVVVSNGQKKKSHQRHRDGLRLWKAMRDGNAAYALLGIENQTDVNRIMPVRNMLYDAMAYQDQIDELARKNRGEGGLDARGILSGLREDDRLLPVATITLHLGPDEWDSPLSVYGMLGKCDTELLSFVSDYKVNLVSPSSMSSVDFGKFATEFGLVLGYIKYQKDKRSLEEFVMRDGRFRNMEAESVELINALTDSHIEIDEGEERIDMCQALKDLRQEGVDEGIELGRREGAIQALASLVTDGVLTLGEAARRAGLTPDEFRAEASAQAISLPL